MTGAIRLSVPEDLAEELLAEELAVPSLRTRSVQDVVQLSFDIVNTGGSVVTIACAAAAVPRVMRKVGQRARDNAAGGPAKVTLRSAGRERIVDVPPSLSLDEAATVIAEAFEKAAGNTS